MNWYVKNLIPCMFSCAFFTSAAEAHFPWLVRGDEGKLQYYFSDGIGDLEYPMPAPVANSEVLLFSSDGQKSKVETEAVDSDRFKGRRSVEAVPRDSVFVAQSCFGLFRGGLLEYTAIHWANSLPTSKPTLPEGTSRTIDVIIVDTETGIDVYPLSQGKPISHAKVTLYNDVGATLGQGETDDEGKLTFRNEVLSNGLMALMFGNVDQTPGEIDGQSYSKRSHYLTVTFTAPPHQPSKTVAAYPELPRGLTSFGAARTEDALYVYGGNTGEAHDYHTGVQSDQLLKLDLKAQSKGWSILSQGLRLQGLGMVAYKDKLIIAGGFTAMNLEGEPQDLRSQDSVRLFDLTNNTWKDLPPLPEARSSHDAAIIGDKLYVVGGWTLQGVGGKSQWLDTAWALDLSNPEAKWEALANTPFHHRALSVVAHKGKLFAIGGMQKDGGPTKSVWIYHPTENQWTQGGSLIGDRSMAGFGNAAWSNGNNLIVCTYEGDIELFDEDEDRWKVIGKTATARFFHRLIPIDQETLVAIGGANMGEGKFLTLEPITVKPQ